MARRLEERVPLLSDDEEQPLSADDLSDLQVSFQQQRGSVRAPQAQRDQAAGRPAGSSDGAGFSAAPAGEEEEEVGKKKKKQYSGNEMIVAVFVVQFDIRRGECVSHAKVLYEYILSYLHVVSM